MISETILNLNKNGSAIRAMFEEGARMAKEFGKENVYDVSPKVKKKYKMDNLSLKDEIIHIWDEEFNRIGDEVVKFIKG